MNWELSKLSSIQEKDEHAEKFNMRKKIKEFKEYGNLKGKYSFIMPTYYDEIKVRTKDSKNLKEYMLAISSLIKED